MKKKITFLKIPLAKNKKLPSSAKTIILQMILVPQLDVIEVGEGMDMVHSEEAVPAVTLPAGTNKDQQLLVDTTEIAAGVSVDNLSIFHFELRLFEQIMHDFDKEKQLTDLKAVLFPFDYQTKYCPRNILFITFVYVLKAMHYISITT